MILISVVICNRQYAGLVLSLQSFVNYLYNTNHDLQALDMPLTFFILENFADVSCFVMIKYRTAKQANSQGFFVLLGEERWPSG